MPSILGMKKSSGRGPSVGTLSLTLSLFVLSFFTSLALSNVSSAGTSPWEKIKIPGAKCGNGGEYKIFIRKGASQKLAFGFSGGGACWSYNTCFGAFSMASLTPVESVNLTEGIFSPDLKKSALADFTNVYLPYCTGDVFMGNHQAVYSGSKVQHVGKVQIDLVLKYLTENGIIDFEKVDEVVLYGSSAGALAALYHASTFSPYTSRVPHRMVIADAPGLHFGKDFWKKFPADQIKDYSAALEQMGMVLNINDGNIASQIPKYCQKFSDWRVGVLQGSKDFVMSVIFGNISMGAHQELVFGKTGLYHETESRGDNCSAWVPVTSTHTFLTSNSSSNYSIDKKTAMEFANDVVMDTSDQNYRDEEVESAPEPDQDFGG